jgi:hypothetical protein
MPFDKQSSAAQTVFVTGCRFFLAMLAFVAAHPVLPALAQDSEAEQKPAPVKDDSPREETVPSTSDYLIDRPDYQPGVPYYLTVKSRWATGLRFSIAKVPVPGAIGNTFQFYLERMFPFLGEGYLCGGIHVGTFPLYTQNVEPDPHVPSPNYGNAIAGAQLRYQLKFTKDPLIVPTGAIEWEFYRIKANEFDDTTLNGTDLGLSFGLMINAGFIDRLTERDAHNSLGLTRAYITAELRTANLNNSLFSLVGNYWLWGLRLELR